MKIKQPIANSQLPVPAKQNITINVPLTTPTPQQTQSVKEIHKK
jgi:hypothetical protein